MTIKRLHKILGEMIDEGQGRLVVVVDKPTYTHPLEQDGAVLLRVHRVESQTHQNIDDDGGTKWRKNGTASTATMCVLIGNTVRCTRCGTPGCHEAMHDTVGGTP